MSTVSRSAGGPALAELIPILQRSYRPRILVVGDVMLDRYFWGNVDRISPEAPIPILRILRQEHRLGGAGSVASMLTALETELYLASVTGDDAEGIMVRQLLEEMGADTHAVIRVEGRPTTVKSRFLGRAQGRHPQQMIRVDHEQDRDLEDYEAERLLQLISEVIQRVELVLVSDYAKGVCGGQFVPRLLNLARRHGVRVVADPYRGRDYRRYAGCACITPNRYEAGLAVGFEIRNAEDGLAAAERLLEFGVDGVIVTLDRDGMAWANRAGQRGLFSVRPRQVYDITGAGDMVLSIIGYYLAAGLDYPQVIELANLAGGLEVERLGVVPITRGELIEELRRGGGTAQAKVLSVDDLEVQLHARRAAGQRIVMTNGCFDLLHPGHVVSLQEARRHGDCLVVGLNSDQSIRALKSAGRPIIDERGRAEMLAALECVDYVVLFDEMSVAPLVGRIQPDVLAKSGEYRTDEVVGHEIVERGGGTIALTSVKGDYSTTGLIHKILEQGDRLLARPSANE